MPWNPEQYHRFQRERFLPFEDLLALIDVQPGPGVIDLGCGTGELTRRLADHLPESEVLGIDSSPQMLERAAGQARPGLKFELRTLEETAGEWDLVFSHAVIQWLDDHPALIPRWPGSPVFYPFRRILFAARRDAEGVPPENAKARRPEEAENAKTRKQ